MISNYVLWLNYNPKSPFQFHSQPYALLSSVILMIIYAVHIVGEGIHIRCIDTQKAPIKIIVRKLDLGHVQTSNVLQSNIWL